MTDWSHLSEALFRQEKFSRLFFKHNELTQRQKEDVLKTFVLSLHAEATSIAEGVNYKDHHLTGHPVDVKKILYESVDAYRYILAILNLWDIPASEFAEALEQKDDFLHLRHSMQQVAWSGQPIVLFDLDDVLAEFRQSFCAYCSSRTGTFFDPNSHEYYNVSEFRSLGLNSESYFRDFVDGHGFRDLALNPTYMRLLRHLKEREGFWIQVVTSRPASNPTALYDTYSWLLRNQVPVDAVAFTPEKMVWLTDQPFYSTGNYFAVDDSAKHVAEYAKHGVPCLVPARSYNREVNGLQKVFYVQPEADPIKYFDLLRSICMPGCKTTPVGDSVPPQERQ